nr:hypothetical protein GTC16762_33190 [Pigmentibacter ruber]
MSKLGKRYINEICKNNCRAGETKTLDSVCKEFISLKTKAINKKYELLKAIEDIDEFILFCEEKISNLKM